MAVGVKGLNVFKNGYTVCAALCCVQYDVQLRDGATFYSGQTELDVFLLAESRAVSWSSLLPWTANSICFPPFNTSCVAVDSLAEYQLKITVIQISPWLVAYFFLGILMFFFAYDFSRSTLLYYAVGMTIGLLCSVLIALMALAYLLPKKHAMLTLSVVAGGSLTLWLLQLVWINLQLLLTTYAEYVCAYVGLCAFLSFAVLHVRGPITNPRVHELITWTVQVCALVLVYHGMHVPWLSVTVIVLLIGQHVLSRCAGAAAGPAAGDR